MSITMLCLHCHHREETFPGVLPKPSGLPGLHGHSPIGIVLSSTLDLLTGLGIETGSRLIVLYFFLQFYRGRGFW